MIGIYPGSFDPPTKGHMDIIGRSAALCKHLYIAVLVNHSKQSYFTIEERVKLLKEVTADLENVEVITFNGLLVDLFNKYRIDAIIKGLRAVSDFEYEFQMAQINRQFEKRAETLFMMTNPRYSYLSSSIVKEFHRYGADISAYVPTQVLEAMKNKRSHQ